MFVRTGARLTAIVFAVLSTTAFSQAPPSTDELQQEIVIVVDADNREALVPEGTVLPAGLRFYGRVSRTRVDEIGLTDTAHEPKGPGPEYRMVFRYAPENRFVDARKAVSSAKRSRPTGRNSLGTYVFPWAVGDIYIYLGDGSLQYVNWWSLERYNVLQIRLEQSLTAVPTHFTAYATIADYAHSYPYPEGGLLFYRQAQCSPLPSGCTTSDSLYASAYTPSTGGASAVASVVTYIPTGGYGYYEVVYESRVEFPWGYPN